MLKLLSLNINKAFAHYIYPHTHIYIPTASSMKVKPTDAKIQQSVNNFIFTFCMSYFYPKSGHHSFRIKDNGDMPYSPFISLSLCGGDISFVG